jgi:hypothetical protein
MMLSTEIETFKTLFLSFTISNIKEKSILQANHFGTKKWGFIFIES